MKHPLLYLVGVSGWIEANIEFITPCLLDSQTSDIEVRGNIYHLSVKQQFGAIERE